MLQLVRKDIQRVETSRPSGIFTWICFKNAQLAYSTLGEKNQTYIRKILFLHLWARIICTAISWPQVTGAQRSWKAQRPHKPDTLEGFVRHCLVFTEDIRCNLFGPFPRLSQFFFIFFFSLSANFCCSFPPFGLPSWFPEINASLFRSFRRTFVITYLQFVQNHGQAHQ